MRQRAITPEYLYRNEDFARLSFETRWLFVALLCCADREGRLRDSPILILADVYPFERETLTVEQVGEMLVEHHQRGFIVRYAIDGKSFVQISDFLKLEKPHQNEARSVIADPGICGARLKPGWKTFAPMAQATSTNCASPLLPQTSLYAGSGNGSFSGSKIGNGSRASDCVSEERAAALRNEPRGQGAARSESQARRRETHIHALRWQTRDAALHR